MARRWPISATTKSRVRPFPGLRRQKITQPRQPTSTERVLYQKKLAGLVWPSPLSRPADVSIVRSIAVPVHHVCLGRWHRFLIPDLDHAIFAAQMRRINANSVALRLLASPHASRPCCVVALAWAFPIRGPWSNLQRHPGLLRIDIF